MHGPIPTARGAPHDAGDIPPDFALMGSSGGSLLPERLAYAIAQLPRMHDPRHQQSWPIPQPPQLQQQQQARVLHQQQSRAQSLGELTISTTGLEGRQTYQSTYPTANPGTALQPPLSVVYPQPRSPLVLPSTSPQYMPSPPSFPGYNTASTTPTLVGEDRQTEYQRTLIEQQVLALRIAELEGLRPELEELERLHNQQRRG